MTKSGYQGPGRYRHYKGGEYEVLGVALREATADKNALVQGGSPEDYAEVDVIYRPLTPGSVLEEATLSETQGVQFWSRSLEDFDAMVEREHGPVPRFVCEALGA